jgi:arylsulfatase A-like enzyme
MDDRLVVGQAFGTITGARAQTPIDSRTVLPIPQARVREQKAMTPDRPFFVHVAFGAAHAPFHVPKPYMDKYRGKFDLGWDQQRDQTFARQKQLGVIPQDAQLTKRPAEIPAWDSMSADERRVAARLMEAYAGFAEHADVQVGRMVDALHAMDALDNTLFLYILGDNGASGEGGPWGALNEIAALNGIVQSAADILPHLDEIGGPMTYCHYPVGWAHAMDTPTNGRSRSPRIGAARATARSSIGRTASKARERFTTSSATSSTSAPRSLNSRACRIR